MKRIVTKTGEGGRLVIPAVDQSIAGLLELRQAANPSGEAVRRAQALVRSYIPEGVRLADELIDERRGVSE